MLQNFDDQIAKIFFVTASKSGSGICKRRLTCGSQTHMGAVIGQAGVGGLGSRTRLLVMIPASRSLSNGVELTAAQNPMAQMHVFVFLTLSVLQPERQGLMKSSR